MTPFTGENLQKAGYNRFEWNGGAFYEYWKTLHIMPGCGWSYRLCVRVNEFPGEPRIYIVGEQTMTRVLGVRSVEQLELLRELLSGDEQRVMNGIIADEIEQCALIADAARVNHEQCAAETMDKHNTRALHVVAADTAARIARHIRERIGNMLFPPSEHKLSEAVEEV